jgi:hypothetical protein
MKRLKCGKMPYYNVVTPCYVILFRGSLHDEVKRCQREVNAIAGKKCRLEFVKRHLVVGSLLEALRDKGYESVDVALSTLAPVHVQDCEAY